MARSRATSSSSSVALAIGLLFMTLVGQSHGQLTVGFYDRRCGNNNVEKIVFDIVKAACQRDRTIVAALLRLQFHDCFVRGCDASILLDGRGTEKTAGPNGSVRGYELIDACKLALEKRCPGVVSCADIIVIATRVSVFLAGGRWYNVETGRRDGITSLASEAVAGLPGPTIPVGVAIQEYAKKGLTAEDFVLLFGGGHTVGLIHCSFFQDRLYNFQKTNRPDPTVSQSALPTLRRICPRENNNNVAAADQTPGSAFVVDNGFYKAIMARKGLLKIDQQIAIDPRTKNIVARLATSGDFAIKFGPAMVKLGRVNVLTGKQGQIRKSCRFVNRGATPFTPTPIFRPNPSPNPPPTPVSRVNPSPSPRPSPFTPTPVFRPNPSPSPPPTPISRLNPSPSPSPSPIPSPFTLTPVFKPNLSPSPPPTPVSRLNPSPSPSPSPSPRPRPSPFTPTPVFRPTSSPSPSPFTPTPVSRPNLSPSPSPFTPTPVFRPMPSASPNPSPP